MRRLCLVFAACGTDLAPTSDPTPTPDVPPGTPIVEVTAPTRAQSFYVTETIGVAWTVADDNPSVSCDVTASGGGAAAISIAAGVTLTVGDPGSATWSLTGVTPAADYVVRVTCSDANGQTGVADSETFAITPPPEPVSFSAQVLPILTGTCTSAQCHDSMIPQNGLDLTAANAYAEIVGVPGTFCTSLDLVEPGQPNNSYLMIKIVGSGACLVGTKMPKPPETLTASEIQQIRDWIANGAQDN